MKINDILECLDILYSAMCIMQDHQLGVMLCDRQELDQANQHARSAWQFLTYQEVDENILSEFVDVFKPTISDLLMWREELLERRAMDLEDGVDKTPPDINPIEELGHTKNTILELIEACPSERARQWLERAFDRLDAAQQWLYDN